MALEMRPACERCGIATGIAEPAMICSYECTFCVECATLMRHICPNCDGELVARPRRGLP